MLNVDTVFVFVDVFDVVAFVDVGSPLFDVFDVTALAGVVVVVFVVVVDARTFCDAFFDASCDRIF